MCSIENRIDALLITFGGVLSLANIESILGIVLLVIQILWLLYKIAIKIYERIRKKKSQDISSDVKCVVRYTNELIKRIKNRKDGEENSESDK